MVFDSFPIGQRDLWAVRWQYCFIVGAVVSREALTLRESGEVEAVVDRLHLGFVDSVGSE